MELLFSKCSWSRSAQSRGWNVALKEIYLSHLPSKETAREKKRSWLVAFRCHTLDPLQCSCQGHTYTKLPEANNRAQGERWRQVISIQHSAILPSFTQGLPLAWSRLSQNVTVYRISFYPVPLPSLFPLFLHKIALCNCLTFTNTESRH